ncbi:MAG TPA: AraC family transcriptional regulator [Bacteroidales bacterium]
MYPVEIGQSISIELKNIARLGFPQTENWSNINSPFSRMYLVTEGKGQLAIGNDTIKLEAGYLYLIPNFTTCNYQFNEGLSHIYIHFNLTTDNGINIYHLFSICNKIAANDLDVLLFNRLLTILPHMELPHHDPMVYQTKPWIIKKIEYQSVGQHLEALGIIRQLFSRFLSAGSENDMSSFLIYKIQPVLVYIQSNLNNDITIDELSALAFFSKDHFTRVFKSIIGIAPCEFIIRKRIEKAQFLLLTTDLTQSQIIEKTNFKSVSYYCRIFKKYTNYTPVEYRKQRIHPV